MPMIMKHNMIAGFLACLTVMASCAREVEQPVKVDAAHGVISFVAVNADDMPTRTVRQADGSVWWSPQEQIQVFYGSRASKFVSDNSSASATATFTGSLDGIEYDGKTQFWALYPYSEGDRFDGQALYFTLPHQQNAVAGTFDRDLFPAVARSSSLELNFRNVCGGIKFRLAKSGVTKVSFKGNQSEPLSGKVQVVLDSQGIPTVSTFLHTETEISLSAPTGGTLKEGEWYHMVAFPATLSKGYTITLTYADANEEEIKTEKSVQIKRSMFGTLSNLAGNVPPPVPDANIVIDGNFSDWAALADSRVVAVVKNNPKSPWKAVKEMRVLAKEDAVFYYVKFDNDEIQEQLKNGESLPIRICLNTDGEFSSGYQSYFLQGYDFIIEGAIADGKGNWATYDGTLYQRVGSWQNLLGSGHGLVFGKGAGNEYEIMLDRALFNSTVPEAHKMVEPFHTGIRFYGNGGWGELSNMPNSSVEEGSGNGWGNLLEVVDYPGTYPDPGTDPGYDPYAGAAPEVKDGDVVLVTNPNVEKFVSEVNYPDKDYSYTKIYDYYGGANGVKYDENGNPDENGTAITNPSSDVPQSFSVRWTADEDAGSLIFHLEESNWSRDVSVGAGESYVNFTNLVPNTHYTYKVTASSGKVMAQGGFDTQGHIRQLFFESNVRNCRDLGGWKTTDGKTVRYHKVYRGGRLEKSTLAVVGKQEILAEGIKAQLDLRGTSDVLSAPAIDGFAFCAPVIESGGTSMLKKDSEKTRQCFEFVVNSLRENKPVYFHCSLGRDRTGTMALLLLGVLGVRDGDISKEYEVTYFAPVGWSIAYSESYTTFQNNRTKWIYNDAAPYFWSFAEAGETFATAVEKYLLSIGVSQKDIDDFRSMMLE